MAKSFDKRRIPGALVRAMAMVLSYSLGAQLILRPASAQEPPAAINIVVVDGEGAANNVGQRSTRFPVVRIEDENQKPISGAAVVFTLPTAGASGEFSDGSKTLIVTTDPRGEAIASGLKVNLIPGKLPIHVSASYRGRTARANITQFNMSVPGKRAGGGSSKVLLIVLAVAGAAAAGGIVAASGNGGGTPTGPQPPVQTPISITPGAGSVGGPR
jgi:hypothetical protein